MKITVLGGGHGCFAAAAEFAEQGHDVCWWRRNERAHQAVSQAGGLNVKDRNGSRHVAIGNLTGDLGAAVKHGQLIVIPLPATTHEDLACRIAPFLESGQVVYLPPGTFGSLHFCARAVCRSTGSGRIVCRDRNAAISGAETRAGRSCDQRLCKRACQLACFPPRTPTTLSRSWRRRIRLWSDARMRSAVH